MIAFGGDAPHHIAERKCLIETRIFLEKTKLVSTKIMDLLYYYSYETALIKNIRHESQISNKV